MIRRPPRSTPLYSSAASDVYKRQVFYKDPRARVAGMECCMRLCDWLSLICASCLLLVIGGAGGAYCMMRQALADRRSVVDPENFPDANLMELAMPPHWAGKGKPAPISYVQLLMHTSPRYIKALEKSYWCEHPRLSKRGTNQIAAQVRCESCKNVLAVYVFPHEA